MKKIALALVALTVAAPAFAQDEPTNFTGPYIAGVTGFDLIDLNTPDLDNPAGVAYGVALGYDFQTGRTVFGIEGEASESSAAVQVGGNDIAVASRDLYVGGRVGVVTGPTLVYLKAGYTNFRTETVVGNDSGDGVRVGVGAEVKLPSNFLVKAEYRYSNYEAEVERHQAILGLGYRF